MTKILLAQQIKATGFALTRLASLADGMSVRSLRPQSDEERDLAALDAARETLVWCGNPMRALEPMLTDGRDPKPVSLNQQIDAMSGAVNRQRKLLNQRSIRGQRSSVMEFEKRRLGDAYRTLQIIHERRDTIAAIGKAAGGAS